MGGASAQITYQCLEEDLSDCPSESDRMDLELYGSDYVIFSKSELCYGLEESLRRFVAGLIYQAFKDNGDKIDQNIKNPCTVEGN